MSRGSSLEFHDLSPSQQALLNELRQNSARAVMLHQLISEKLGLNATDHKCLDFLNRTGAVTAGQLAQLTGLTTGAVTNVIDRLEQAGYVTRDKDPNDRRRVVVKPAEGRSAQISPLFQSVMQSTLQILSRYDEQQTSLILEFIRLCNEMTLAEMDKLKNQADSNSD
ncbi:MarR family transcriptional regulator [Cohnella thailandensis]|uniref:MarR family transcriptional regulator n=1 Tax=Cohnella thailandensis TaxID=557557 RepID=A0A841SX40_9BACL|nr:MarR family transcriptional regulator [Cohnella thailandensis]MBB6633311.1 MarR family transcriptional regulator [Cohnella thailandensis]MBP1977352.1 DNA-binding MarR family transcriptional regulator [Cohnella thailandensis]